MLYSCSLLSSKFEVSSLGLMLTDKAAPITKKKGGNSPPVLTIVYCHVEGQQRSLTSRVARLSV